MPETAGFGIDECTRSMPAIRGPLLKLASILDSRGVRTYSSGSRWFLHCQCGHCTRPDVLIVTKPLSVGDADFQHKKLVIVLFAFRQCSALHLLIDFMIEQAIQSLCHPAILMAEDGLACKARQRGDWTITANVGGIRAADSPAGNVCRGANAHISRHRDSQPRDTYSLLNKTRQEYRSCLCSDRVHPAVVNIVNVDYPPACCGFMIKGTAWVQATTH